MLLIKVKLVVIDIINFALSNRLTRQWLLIYSTSRGWALVAYNTCSGVRFYNFYRNTQILFYITFMDLVYVLMKILYFVSKGSLIIPEYRCLLIGRVQYLYTIEHALENIIYTIGFNRTLLLSYLLSAYTPFHISRTLS